MDYLISYFNQVGIKLHQNKYLNYYPGSCDQCQMKNGGQKCILYGLTPKYSILICEHCNLKMESLIKKTINTLQSISKYHNINKNLEYMILDENGLIQNSFKINKKYIFNIYQNKNIYVPLINKNKQSCYMPYRTFCILNDIKL
jgi:hypothetical protein